MRQVIIDIGDVFRTTRSNHITDYVQQQFNRVVLSPRHDVAVSLHDVSERLIALNVQALCEGLDLDFKALRDCVWVLPVVDKEKDSLSCVVELRPALFEALLSRVPSVTLDRVGFIYKGDTYQSASTDEWCLFENHPENLSNPILACVVNYTVNEQQGHCLISQKELESIREDYINIKFGGLDPLSDQEWSELLLAATYRRLFSDDSFVAMRLHAPGNVVDDYTFAIDHHNQFFKQQANSENIVRDRFGRVIGRTVKKYDALQVAKFQQERQSIQPAQPTVVSLESARAKREARVLEVTAYSHDNASSPVVTIDIDAQMQITEPSFDGLDELYFDEPEFSEDEYYV